MSNYQIESLGTIHNNEGKAYIRIDKNYKPGLQGLEGFSHLMILWWFSEFDTAEARSVLEVPKPYAKAPDILGIFATRSPVRPNPLALSAVEVISYDFEEGIIHITYTDAHDGTPLLDIKPYTPSSDRVETPSVPTWCSHWPKSFETSGDFNWEQEFMF